MRHDRAARRAANTAAAAAVALVPLLALKAPADADVAYTARSTAQLIGVNFTTQPGVVFDQLVDAGVSQAQAQIDSLGSVSAFAAEPYPSTSVVMLPGLASGFTPSGVPKPPNYPLIASSTQASPSDHKVAGSIVLDASSVTGNSKGSVTDGATQAVATTTFASDTGIVEAHANSTISNLTLDGAVVLDGVHSEATLTKQGDTATRSASFEIGAIHVAGVTLGVTDKGLVLAGTSVPLGIDPNKGLAPVLGRLASEGFAFTYIPERKTKDTVTSGGLEINMLRPVSTGGLDAVSTSVTVGLARATVTSTTIPGFDGGITPVPPASPPPSQDLSPDNVDTGSDGTSFGTGPTPGGMGTLPSSGPTGQKPFVAPAGTTPTSAMAADDISLGKFYPVLFIAALTGVGLVHLIRSLAVRNP